MPAGSFLTRASEAGAAALYARDAEKALALFAEEGYIPDAAGRLCRDGAPLEIRIAALARSGLADLGQEIRRQLADFGISASFQVYDDDEFSEALRQKREIDCYLQNNQTGADALKNNLFAMPSYYLEDGVWQNEDVWEKMGNIPLAQTFDEAVTAYQAVFDAYLADMPQIPLAAPGRFVAAHPAVSGVSLSAYRDPLWNVGAWSIGS
jgi:ABC-type transport system substrate-binding protein